MDVEKNSQPVRQRLTKLMKEQSLSLNELCKRSKVPYSTANSFMIGKSKDLTMDTLFELCCGLGIRLKDFLILLNLNNSKMR